MRLINATPHDLNIVRGEEIETIAPSGIVPRVAMVERQVGSIAGVPVFATVAGEVEGLPAAVTDVIYVVSRMVAAALPTRDDLVCPHRLVRDENGRIIGCSAFARA